MFGRSNNETKWDQMMVMSGYNKNLDLNSDDDEALIKRVTGCG